MGGVKLSTGMLLLAILLLSGCATLKQWHAQAQARDQALLTVEAPLPSDSFAESSLIDRVLGFYSVYQKMPEGEQIRSRNALEARVRNKGSSVERLQLAMLEITRPQPVDKKRQVIKDLEHVKKALKKEIGSNEPEALVFIDMILALLNEDIYVYNKALALESELARNKGQLKELRQQINALKSIENNIHERELGLDPLSSQSAGR